MKRRYRSVFVGKGTLVHAVRLDAEGRDDPWTLCGRDFRDAQGRPAGNAGDLTVGCSRCIANQEFSARFDLMHHPKSGTEALEDFIQHLRGNGDAPGNDDIIWRATRFMEGWKSE